MITNILSYLEASAGKTPDKVAFAQETRSCTFAELENASRQVGSVLCEAKVQPKTPVPVFMEKGVPAIMAMMGIVQAGAFYVVMDIHQPAFRLSQILDTLKPEVILVSRENEKEFALLEHAPRAIWIEDCLDRAVCEEALRQRREAAKNTDPLYGIFTSGSTGIPKGVLVSHRSVIDFIEYFTDLFDITEKDVIGNQAPWDFDVSVKDIYSGLKAGARVEVIPRRLFSVPMQLLDLLEERQVTTLIWAVSAVCIISTLHGFEYKVPTSIRKVLFSGESMPIKHLREWRKYLPDVMYVNLYGPTEITCNCTYHIIDREYEPGESLPIGKAFPNETVYLLDDENREIREPGKKGEICVTGTALALGYYRNPEQTQKAFVQNPLNDSYPERMYRTGDLGYYGEDGLLYFASRKDFQIKHMGHRIELGEIEIAMERIPEVTRSCCIFDMERNKIVAFYKGDIEKRELKKRLGAWLPSFMLPNRMVQVENMPLTKNGKIDRAQLMKEMEERHGK